MSSRGLSLHFCFQVYVCMIPERSDNIHTLESSSLFCMVRSNMQMRRIVVWLILNEEVFCGSRNKV